MAESLTQKDLAERLGISPSTVSLALRNDMRISDEIRARVHALAAETGYTFHLRQNATPEVQNVVFVCRHGADDHFYSKILSGAVKACQQNQISMHYSQLSADNQLAVNLEQVSAFLFVGAIAEDVIARFMKLNRPIVLVDNNLPDMGLDRVLTENLRSIYRTTLRLIDRGHRQIAFMDGPKTPSIHDRREGYLLAMKERNLEPQVLPSQENDYEAQREFMRAWLAANGRPDFSALICRNDSVAIGSMHALQEYGLRVPEDISVIGFDDTDMAMVTSPALSTHHVYREMIGENAVRLLLERLANPGRPVVAVTIEPAWIERDSTRI
jgi:DNA-binding LacI/PurR family transcriptional regulator